MQKARDRYSVDQPHDQIQMTIPAHSCFLIDLIPVSLRWRASKQKFMEGWIAPRYRPIPWCRNVASHRTAVSRMNVHQFEVNVFRRSGNDQGGAAVDTRAHLDTIVQ